MKYEITSGKGPDEVRLILSASDALFLAQRIMNQADSKGVHGVEVYLNATVVPQETD